MELLITILVKLGLGKVLDWLGFRREIRAAEGRGRFEGRAEVHAEIHREKVEEICGSPPPKDAQAMNEKNEARKRRGMG